MVGHRVDTRRSTRHVLVRVDDEVVADSGRPVALFESSLPPPWCVPREDVTVPLEPAVTQTVRPYKGWSTHCSIAGHDEVAFSYEEPLGESRGVLGTVCFLGNGVATAVDGVEV